jgi:hypothetical protein
MIDLSPTELRELRLRAQCLQPPLPRDQLMPAVRAICGAQAQLSSSMMLQLRARVSGLTVAEIEDAIGDSRYLVRTWAMRGTLHLVLAQDVRWLGSFLGPIFVAQDKGRRRQLGLDEDATARGLHAIRAILHNSEPLTRGEVVARLEEEGLTLERRSQAPIHLIRLAALEGLVCLGPEQPNGESTYTLIDRWIEPGQSLTREQALTELARRYFAGYGPATPQDLAAWAGLSLTDAKRGWASVRDQGRLTEVHVEERNLWHTTLESGEVFSSRSSEPVLRLLPAFDPYVLGYADRRDVVPREHQRRVYHGGQTAPVVLVNGLASGVWRYERRGRRLQITVHAFDSFDYPIQRLIAAEADDIGRFWQAPVSLSYSAITP